MTTARKLSMSLVVALGVVWSLLLAFGGAWLAGNGHAVWGASLAQITRIGGLVGVLAGMVVFLVCVADRVFPRASRKVTLAAEVPLCVMLFVGIGVMVWAAW